jgi:hypothetical protein
MIRESDSSLSGEEGNNQATAGTSEKTSAKSQESYNKVTEIAPQLKT